MYERLSEENGIGTRHSATGPTRRRSGAREAIDEDPVRSLLPAWRADPVSMAASLNVLRQN